MLLTKVELRNFRSFYGTKVIEFARVPNKAVTVFHGENGAGKTNILNAIYWCVTGEFTPRFQDSHLLVNKTAVREKDRETYVELHFIDNDIEYRARRTMTGGEESFELWSIRAGNSKVVANGERVIARFVPKSLVSWFFFDAEAIGSLELSGSEQFKQDLRKTLGFALVDTLVRDLELARNRLQREVSVQVNNKDMAEIQEQIDRIEHVLPGQEQLLIQFDEQLVTSRKSFDRVSKELAKLPQSAELQKRRETLENQQRSLSQQKTNLEKNVAQLCGRVAPSVFLREKALAFEDTLEIQELRGKLPRPYSDQLVKDILEDKLCICGREVLPGSGEAEKIADLMKFASTGALNQRIRAAQLVIRDVDTLCNEFTVQLTDLRRAIATSDQQVGEGERELAEIKSALDSIDVRKIAQLNADREKLLGQIQTLSGQQGVIRNQIEQNKKLVKELQLRYEKASAKVTVGAKLQRELSKVSRLLRHVQDKLADHESRALRILTVELNRILDKYLAKHFKAKINPETYAVNLQDESGQAVGHSTGEGQVLKFAFISTVVALAGKKTLEKIDFMAEPTEAPLVLDAPLSALDPAYQGSVAKNLANQTNQLVLMLSSAGWSDSVSGALKQSIGKEYVLESHTAGPRGNKPVRTARIWNKEYQLDHYDSERDESVIVRVA